MDRIGHAVERSHHVMIGKTKHAVSLAPQERRALLVMSNAVGVCIAIDLDDKARGLTHEVGEIGSKALLATEFEAREAATAQDRPQALFGQRRIATKLTSASDTAVIAFVA